MSPASLRVAAVSALLAALAAGLPIAGPARAQSTNSGQVQQSPPVPAPRDRETNLALKITEPFVVTSVGDVMIRRPGGLDAPEFTSVAKLIKDADVAFGNMEGNLTDLDHFDGPLQGMMGDKDVAPFLKSLGFDMMARANNHVFDSERESMFSTIDQLDKAGIINAGTGRDLEQARAPAYFDTPKGRVGLVSMHTPHTLGANPSIATYRRGEIGGKAGMNPLRLEVIYNVTQGELDELKAIRKSIYTPPPGTTNISVLPPNEPTDSVELLDVRYKVGPPGTRSFEMNKDDFEENMRSIRNGKYLSEFMIASCHCHHGPIPAQQWLFEDQTPDFLPVLAHAAIDNGADMFVGHGPHVLRGVEIYKGKPIFYGMGEHYYQWQHFDSALLTGSWPRQEPKDGIDVAVTPFLRPVNFESMVAQSFFDKGKLVEVRLYPTIGGWDGPISRLGIPRTPPPEQAQKILMRVQALSKPFGTTISIENNIGIIRVSDAAPAAPRK